MRVPPALPPPLTALVREQEGAMTTGQAVAAGLSHDQLRTLVAHGWWRMTRGIYVEPHPVDPFRASIRAALLACPEGVACGPTAARIQQLWGLPKWTQAERPHLLLPVGDTYNARTGIQLRTGLRPGEKTSCAGFPVTILGRTVASLSNTMPLDELVCLLDSAKRRGWDGEIISARGQRKLRAALALADARSESPLETLLRLLLVRAGLAPEALQFKVYYDGGRRHVRLDMAWPSVKLAVEADGREVHDEPDALYHDRHRANEVVLAGWTILRFTWSDVLHRPAWVVSQVGRALSTASRVR